MRTSIGHTPGIGLAMLPLLFACAAPADETAAARLSVERLSFPDASERIAEHFTQVGDVIEVDDSLVLVHDVGEQSVWAVSFSEASRAPFGRSGDGPGEYRSVAALLRLGEDTVVIASAGPAPRLAMLTTRGLPLGSRSLELPRAASSEVVSTVFDEWPPQPSAFDRRGFLYGVRPRTPLGMEPLPLDQERQVLVRFDASLSRLDTITHVRPSGVYRGRLVAGQLEYDLPLGPFEASDAWSVLADGTVIVVDEQSYAVTVYPARGGAKAARRIPHTARLATEAMWQQYVDSARSALLEMFKGAPGMAGGLTHAQIRVPEAPATFPPVAADRTRRPLSDGSLLWIPVHRGIDTTREHWDVLRADGTLTARHELPPNVRLVAVSNRYLYTAETTDDELEVLTRVPRSAVASRGAEAANRAREPKGSIR
ncbi:MAG TPA: hypothetical protein PKE51_05050 [Gemmatimonadaceae bacterium]|nr:hypothetical protein [Gemmatimonadaceae bacterium]